MNDCKRSVPITRVPKESETIRILRAIYNTDLRTAVVAGGGEMYLVKIESIRKEKV